MTRNRQREDAEVDEAKRKLVPRLVVAVLALVVGLTGAVSARPGSGASGVVLAQGRMPGRLKIKTRDASDVVVQQVTLQPGGFTGWHTHPGVVLAVVKAGTLTRYVADCTYKTYRTGDAFIETEVSTWGATRIGPYRSSCTSPISTRLAARCGSRQTLPPALHPLERGPPERKGGEAAGSVHESLWRRGWVRIARIRALLA
jgi:hypothetical protein